jgi:DNA polymerase-1
MENMQVCATRKDAYQLMFLGALALSKIQSNGIRMDVDYLHSARLRLADQIKQEEEEFKKLPDVKYWQKKFGPFFNPASDDQLAHVLFDHLEYEAKRRTKSGKPSVDANVLEELLEETGNEMLKVLMHMRKLDKAYGTYIEGIIRETNADGFLRPFFSLYLARTYRSSSNSPNFQNIPVRDEEIKKLIRTAFIPREDRQILEVDFKGIEVNVAYFYHRDPSMRDYLTDSSKDMHRDMSMELYMLAKDQWNKKTRHAAKNKFVFPEFYGSYWAQVGPDLWKAIALNKLHIGKNNDGIGLYEHLNSLGIYNIEMFNEHVRKVEDKFWNDRFPVYTQWKQDWIDQYNECGYFDSLTGFRYIGILRRNEIINYPVQGSAFHCLLWTLIQLQNWLEENRMESLIVGQIHDSMVIDLVPAEKDAILTQVQQIVRKDLSVHFPWIDFPMSIEAELADINDSWLNKKEISLSQYMQ